MVWTADQIESELWQRFPAYTDVKVTAEMRGLVVDMHFEVTMQGTTYMTELAWARQSLCPMAFDVAVAGVLKAVREMEAT